MMALSRHGPGFLGGEPVELELGMERVSLDL